MSYASAVPNSSYTNPLSQVEIKISCRNLLDLDVFSKSDPFSVFYMRSSKYAEWREIGRTEIIWNTLNPDFVKSFIVDYFFEQQQFVKIEVYDADSQSHDLSKHDFIGKLVTSVGSIVGENGGKFEHPLQLPTAKDEERNDRFKKKSPGTIIVTAEEISTNKDVVHLEVCAKKLDKLDLFGKSDPFLTFERSTEDGSYLVVHKTEVIKTTLNPSWERFSIKSQVLCNGDPQRTLLVKCWDWERNGGHRLIGQFETTQSDLISFRNNGRSSYNLIHPEKKRKKKNYKNSGTLYIINCEVIQKATFIDYISGGLELAFVVAIDFTASNGNPTEKNSLHYNGPNQPSQYVQALQAVGSVLEDYDTDKLFPAYGFGAKIQGKVLHEFALNFNPTNPNCQGINGVIAAYYNSLANVELYGPTNFSPVINSAASIARDAIKRGLSQYFILLIITDGIITDMERTKEAIVEAAKLPISIIIVGVGKADFEAMEVLDGDEVRLTDMRGRVAERDIVQFVPFQDYMSKTYTGDHAFDSSQGFRLARDVLHELPDQLLLYMEQHHIKPNIAPPAYSP